MLHLLQSLVYAVWLTLDMVEVLCAIVTESAALLPELVDADRRQLGGAVVLGAEVVCLVYGYRCMDDLGLDGLLVDDWLNSFMDVMVDVFTLDGGSRALGVGGAGNVTSVVVFPGLGGYGSLGLIVVAVVELSGLDVGDPVMVILWHNSLVLDWLNGMVVMVLMDLLLHGCVDLFVCGWLDRLVFHGRVDLLVDSGVVVS